MAKSSAKEFLKRKNVDITVWTYLIDVLGAMAFDLFASLLIGTIFSTLGQQFQIEIFNVIADYAKGATDTAPGIVIAHILKAPQLVLFSIVTVSIVGSALGGPVDILIATIMAAELGRIVSKEARLDIIVTPGITIISGALVARLVGPGAARFMGRLGNLVKTITEMWLFIMGVLMSALIGIALTLPISSVATYAALSLDELAGNAATADCCVQMVEFAVMSYRENKIDGLMAQGLGTSMLQMGNIVLNPHIWVPPTLASVTIGPITTMVFRLESILTGPGMNTYGLIDPVGVYAAVGSGTSMRAGILLVCFLLPTVLTFVLGEVLRKMGWIRNGDSKLSLQGGRYADGGFESGKGVEDGQGGLAHDSLGNSL